VDDISRLTRQTLIGMAFGAIAGGLLGPYAGAWFGFIGTVYTNLLVVCVFPFLISSLIYSLGSLTPDLSKKLFKSGLFIYLLFVVLVFSVLVILTFLIPHATELLYLPSSNKENIISQLIKIIVPSNLFSDLLNEYIPAVIVFCVIFGLMLQRVEKKEAIIPVLQTIANTCLEFWNLVIRFTPLAGFSFFSSIIGNLTFTQLQYTGFYLLLCILATLILGFWLFPLLIIKLANVSSRRIIQDTREAILIAVMTGAIITVLPALIKSTDELLKEKKIKDEKTSELIDVIITVAYPFAQFGNYVAYLFVLFAGFYFNTAIPYVKQLFLPIVSWLSFIGNMSATYLSFKMIATWLHLPAESSDLLVELSQITKYFSNIISVLGVYGILLLTLFSFYKKIQFNKTLVVHLIILYLSLFFIVLVVRIDSMSLLLVMALITFCVVFFIMYLLRKSAHVRKKIGSLIGGLIIIIAAIYGLNLSISDELQVNKYSLLNLGRYHGAATANSLSPSKLEDSNLENILEKKVIRVGYLPNFPPFSYRNHKNELVGIGIEYAYRLAERLNIDVVFIPIAKSEIVTSLNNNQIDIFYFIEFIGDAATTNLFDSSPTHFSYLTFVTRHKYKKVFGQELSRLAKKHLVIGVIGTKEVSDAANVVLPNKSIINFNNLNSAKRALEKDEIKAIALPYDVALPFVNYNHGYLAIVPPGEKIIMPVAFLMKKKSFMLNQLVNHWGSTIKRNGTAKQLYHYWIHAGFEDRQTVKRWNLIDYLLKQTKSR
jgi:proton glutamate symport protein